MTLIELFGLLRRHLAFVIALPVLAALLAYGVALLLPDEYTASTTMYVLTQNQRSEGDASELSYSDLNMGQLITNDVATLVKSNRVKNHVTQKLSLTSSAKYALDIVNSATTRVITINVTSTDAQLAADVANAIVEEVSNVAVEVMQVQSVNVIDVATAPETPSGPRRRLIGALGAMGGLFVAVAVVVLRDTMNTRVRRPEDIEKLIDAPIVGHFPTLG